MADKITPTIPEIIERAAEVYGHDAVVTQLGEEKALRLQACIQRAVAADVVGNVVNIPDNAGPEAIPIIALRGGQRVKMSEQFLDQTPLQRINAAKIVESWKPIGETATSYLAHIGEFFESRGGEQPFYLAPNTGAFVSPPEATFAFDKSKFKNLPSGFALYFGRPLLGLLGTANITPDILAHELVHIHQRINEPIRAFDSQEAIDFAVLRDELEGYHVGAQVRVALEGGIRPRIPYRIPESEMARLNQVAVDNIRHKNNKNCGDPYRPTRPLVRELSRSMGLSILHHTLDYGKVMADLNKYASFHVD